MSSLMSFNYIIKKSHTNPWLCLRLFLTFPMGESASGVCFSSSLSKSKNFSLRTSFTFGLSFLHIGQGGKLHRRPGEALPWYGDESTGVRDPPGRDCVGAAQMAQTFLGAGQWGKREGAAA